ncbi:MAG: hypothetical protein KKD17_05270 [Nanoarchaeota archaeon]|nr:hypothetical protein [Nanoarchaeota archaeon]
MSLVNLYLKESGMIKEIRETPLFAVKDLLIDNFREDDLRFLKFREHPAQCIAPYDLGVFLVDFDAKMILSAQNGFGLENLDAEVKSRLLKTWKFEEVESYEEVAKRLGMKCFDM